MTIIPWNEVINTYLISSFTPYPGYALEKRNAEKYCNFLHSGPKLPDIYAYFLKRK